MEHKKTADNRAASKDDTASRSEQLLKIPPPPPLAPIYAPTLEPGERFRREKIRRMSRPPLKEEEKPQ